VHDFGHQVTELPAFRAKMGRRVTHFAMYDCCVNLSKVDMNKFSVALLADRLDLLNEIAGWFESEWPAHYGAAGSACALIDLQAYADRDDLPLGLLILWDDKPCGFGALKKEPFPTHSDLFPWIGAGYVKPELRRKGIGAALLTALEELAMKQKIPRVYCATSTSASLLIRCGWQLRDKVDHEGQETGIYEKAL
jgi:GNAT superfamily N-acetyltransferase